MEDQQENQTRFFGSLSTASFSLQAAKEMAKSPPRGQSKCCHFDFSWMLNSKCSAKQRISLQLIPPITPHHRLKASNILPSGDGFLAKGEIGHSFMDTRGMRQGPQRSGGDLCTVSKDQKLQQGC